MIIQCESCATRFKISDDKVGDAGVKVRCSKCNHVFTAKKESAVASQVPTPAFDGGFGSTGNQSNIFRPPPMTGAAIPAARAVTGIFRAPTMPGAAPVPIGAANAPRPATGVWPAMQPPPGAAGPSLPSASEFGRPDTFIGDSAITIIPASAMKGQPPPSPPPSPAPSSSLPSLGGAGMSGVYDPFSPPPPPQAKGGDAGGFDPFGAMPTVPALPRKAHGTDPFAGNGGHGSGIADPFTSSARPQSPPPSPPPMAPDPFAGASPDLLDPFSNPLPTGDGASIPDSYQAQSTIVATRPAIAPPEAIGGDADPFDAPTRTVAAPDLAALAAKPVASTVDPWQVSAEPSQPLGKVPFPSPPMGTAAPMATVSQTPGPAGDDPFAGMGGEGGMDDGGSLFPTPSPPAAKAPKGAKGASKAAAAHEEDPFANLGIEMGNSGAGEPLGDVATRIHQISPELAAEARRVRDEMSPDAPPAAPPKAAPVKALPPPKGASPSEPDGPRGIARVAWSVAWQAAVLGAFLTVSLVVARGGSVDDILAGRAVAVLAGDASVLTPDAVKAPVRVEDVVVARRPVRGDSGLVVVSGVVVNEGQEAIPAAKVVVGFGDAARSFSGIAGAVVDGTDLVRATDRASLDALASAWPTAPTIAAGARVPFVVLATDVRDGARADISVQPTAPPAPPVVEPEPAPPPLPVKGSGKGAKVRAAPAPATTTTAPSATTAPPTPAPPAAPAAPPT